MRVRVAIAAALLLPPVAACDSLFGPGRGPVWIASPAHNSVVRADTVLVQIATDHDGVEYFTLIVDGFAFYPQWGAGEDTITIAWPAHYFWADGRPHELVARGTTWPDEDSVGESDPITVTVHESVSPIKPSLRDPIDSMVFTASQDVVIDWMAFLYRTDIVYVTHVAPDSDFAAAVESRIVGGLTYQRLELAPGAHYWRVRHELPTGHTSAWSEVRRFDILDVDLNAILNGRGIPGAAQYAAGPGLHPILATGEFNDSLPVEWLARSVNELELVGRVEFFDRSLEECSYTGPGCAAAVCTFRRVRREARGVLYAAATADSLAAKGFEGSDPPRCPDTYSFGSTKKVYAYGSPVGCEPILHWLTGYVAP